MNRVQQRVVALSIAFLGGAIVAAVTTNHSIVQTLFLASDPLAITVAVVLLTTSFLVLIASFDTRSTTRFLRLDWFVPMIRKLKPGQSPSSSLIARWSRRFTPAFMQSNHLTKQRGGFRKALRWLGPSWLASPVRRLVQTICLLTFIVLFFYVCWPYSARPAIDVADTSAWPSHYADNLTAKERIPAETFLIIDPLVSLSTAVASRSWVWSLVSAAAILIVCVLIPRGFCGYVCPLGTTIDLFDWAIGSRVKRFRVADDGWWVHIKYYLLAGTMVAAVCGVLISGFFSAIPIITRGMLFIVDPLQSGVVRGWHLVPSFHVGHFISIAIFAAVLGLGFFRPRFWCKYVCPSGAVFSLGNLFRVTERKVESSCIHCNKCVVVCPFDAIKPDFTTRTSDCTLCQTCGGVCPTHAIKFVERWNVVELKLADDPPTKETALGRRGFLSLAAGSSAAIVGGAGFAAATKAFGANLDDPNAFRPVRPPGSVPEREFLEMCIRCGECFKACPNNVLQVERFQQGLEGLWTPMVIADWAGCESSCNACGQVCPTGAIRALPLFEKKAVRMGLAIVNESTCLPFVGREACDLCVQECNAAGYHAIEYTQVGTEVDVLGQPVEGTGYLAPVVLADQCVGCGLCQTRCYAINVKQKHLLDHSAIVVEAGDGKEDRLMTGSYVKLRQAERSQEASTPTAPSADYFIPEAAPSPVPSPTPVEDDPFGLSTEAL